MGGLSDRSAHFLFIMVNSKKKGNRNERQIAKTLSEWWGEEFTRTPSSGMFATTHARQLSALNVDIGGDLISPKNFPFNVEAKSAKSIDLYEAIRQREGSCFVDWWRQSNRDAKNMKKWPLVIFKEDRKQYYCMMTSYCYSRLERDTKYTLQISIDDDMICFITLKELMELNKEFVIKNLTNSN